MKKTYLYILIGLIIIGLGIGGYFIYKNIKKTNNKNSNQETISALLYTNANHNLTIKYPSNWIAKDLGGEKNITTPLTREEVIYFYDPTTLPSDNNILNATTSARVIRYKLSDDTKITSEDDWYNYIKAQVDKYISEKAQASGYTSISVDKKTIDGKWAVEENYYEPADTRGQDEYIYNPKNNEFYQIVTKSPKNLFNDIKSNFDVITNDFHISN